VKGLKHFEVLLLLGVSFVTRDRKLAKTMYLFSWSKC